MEIINGFIAGVGQSIISHPLDTYKTWLQVQHKEIITIKGLYRGFTYPTLFNSLVNGFAFQSYEYGKNSDIKYNTIIGGLYAGIVTGILSTVIEYKKIKSQLDYKIKFNKQCIITMLMREIPACICYYPIYDLLKENNYSTVLSGGIAGITCWTSSYCFDTLNTHVMSGMTIKQVIKKLSFLDYYRGISICIPRAFLINSVSYYFYEFSKQYFN